MARTPQKQVEFRYYELEEGMPLLALMGDSWKKEYGKDASCQHFHNFLEIGRCRGGGGSMVFDEEERRFTAGSLTLIPKNMPHETRSDKGSVSFWEYLFVDVEAFLRDVYRSDLLFAKALSRRVESSWHLLEGKDCPQMQTLVDAVFQEMAEKKEFYREKVRGLLQALLLEAGRLGQGDYAQSSSVQITAALQYMEEHYAEPIRIGELAALCHMSETNFRRLFGDIMNLSPRKYLNLIRVEAACELMQQSRMTLGEIAEQTGFGVASSLSRAFKSLLGVSPRVWRSNPGHYAVRNRYRVSALRGWY